jgi:ABC-type phosphate/phosphonate transport system substrate-binding protein
MRSKRWAAVVFLTLITATSWAHALVFAVNEGMTYRVSNDEIRARYAAVATDLAKLLGQPVQIEPVGDYQALRQGLAAKAYDLALVHPAHVSIVAMKASG